MFGSVHRGPADVDQMPLIPGQDNDGVLVAMLYGDRHRVKQAHGTDSFSCAHLTDVDVLESSGLLNAAFQRAAEAVHNKLQAQIGFLGGRR